MNNNYEFLSLNRRTNERFLRRPVFTVTKTKPSKLSDVSFRHQMYTIKYIHSLKLTILSLRPYIITRESEHANVHENITTFLVDQGKG